MGYLVLFAILAVVTAIVMAYISLVEFGPGRGPTDNRVFWLNILLLFLFLCSYLVFSEWFAGEKGYVPRRDRIISFFYVSGIIFFLGWIFRRNFPKKWLNS